MNSIGDFLGKYFNFTPPGRVLEAAAAAAIEEILGMPPPPGSLVARDGIVAANFGGALKSELLIRKSEILAAARKRTGPRLRDIR